MKSQATGQTIKIIETKGMAYDMNKVSLRFIHQRTKDRTFCREKAKVL